MADESDSSSVGRSIEMLYAESNQHGSESKSRKTNPPWRSQHPKRNPPSPSSSESSFACGRSRSVTSHRQTGSASKPWRTSQNASLTHLSRKPNYGCFNEPSSSVSHYSRQNAFNHVPKGSRYNPGDGDCESTKAPFRMGREASQSRGRPSKEVKFVLSTKKTRDDYSLSMKDKDHNVKYIGYKYIHDLTEKTPVEMVCEILKPNSPFFAFLSEPELEADWLMLVVKTLKNVCSSSFSGNISEMLSRVLRSQLMHAISYYLSDVEMESSEATLANMKTFLEDLTDLLASITNVLPHVSVERDLKKMIAKTAKAIEKVNKEFDTGVEEKWTQKLETLGLKLDNYKEVCERKKNPSEGKSRTYQDRLAEMAPPDDFRALSLHPTYDDLMRKGTGFVRPNKAKGAYQDVQHYLDVQFRLLREDFIGPLRTGLRQYAEAKKDAQTGVARRIKSKYESVRFYRDTKFETSTLTDSHELGFVLVFDPHNRLKIKWEYSKRFMFGSLLLFSNDGFETFFYGTVLQRDENSLRRGRVLVKLPSEIEINEEFFEHEFLTAESEVFFEPYFLVMKRLQLMKEDEFPMPEYIVFGERETERPAYLTDVHNWNVLGHVVDPSRDDGWPAAAELQLDESQYAAFKTALTSNFCVLQGPPGTGKTFIGLKIVEVLLKNIHRSFACGGVNFEFRTTQMLREAKAKPILVVCYTNHALDQFLEGITAFTSKIVRAGSRSNSDILKNFNLRGRDQISCRREARQIHAAHSSIIDEVTELNKGIRNLAQLRSTLESPPSGIVKYELLVTAMNDYQRSKLTNEKDLLRWLLPIYSSYDFASSSQSWREERAHNEKQTMHERKECDLFEDDDCLVDELLDFDLPTFTSPYCLELKDFQEQRHVLESQRLDVEYSITKATSSTEYSHLMNMLRQIDIDLWEKMKLSELLRQRLMKPLVDISRHELISQQNINRLTMDERWLLYWSWVAEVKRNIAVKQNASEKEYALASVRLNEYKQMEDAYVIEKADVVGMTTTCAARLHHVLQTVKPTIVIVEEAAEVLEAHIVCSLTEACEHVILIGDHKQLKPSAAVYELCKKFNMDVSLFERMINNGMYCPMLRVQHRMRPEISKLITPSIYHDLIDDESVKTFDPIRGVRKNVFFLEHNEFEQEADDSSSRKNLFEVDFLLKLCEYLVYQNYDPSKITILTTYSGQMFLFREKKRQYPKLADVKCIVVDKYQGEENEIILLSLVRSNEEAKVGFLKTENRVCVALSRARQGLYIVGNMDNLCASSPLWQEIKKTLQEDGAVGRELQLYCEKHDLCTNVSRADDFDKVNQGGCVTACAELMKCGHTCQSTCHKVEHDDISCHEPCPRTCPRSHPCTQYCYEACKRCLIEENRTLPCGHEKILPCYIDEQKYYCEVIVDDVSPICQHAIKRKCGEAPETTRCDENCGARLDCGHVCPEKCHKRNDPDHVEFKCRRPCERLNDKCSKSHVCKKLCFEECGLCTVFEMMTLPCGHEENLQCCTDLNTHECYQKCQRFCADCKAKCGKKCFEKCAPCLNKVKKVIEECGHTVKVKCAANAVRQNCTKPCERTLSCGHKCKAACAEECRTELCREPFRWEGTQGLCGHKFLRILCNERDKDNFNKVKLLSFCDEPCGAKLKCGDICTGTCGSCSQGRMHRSCEENCGNVLICGHTCRVKCREICPPCNERCSFRCKHSSCPKKCGVPCVECTEICEWQCKHSKCTEKCGQMCNRKPCYKACEEQLPCGHACIGFCGEPCPPLCRECNPEITEIIFGWEDEPDARFVLLEDCGHTIESKALDKHLLMPSEGGEITVKVCPLCKTPIFTTLRYMNVVKTTYQHILHVKRKIFGNQRELKGECEHLLDRLLNLQTKYMSITRLSRFQDIDNVLRKYIHPLIICQNNYWKRKQINISSTDLKALVYFATVFEIILSRLDDLFIRVVRKVPVKQPPPRGRGRRWFQTQQQQLMKEVTDTKLDTSDVATKTLVLLKSLVDKMDRMPYRVNQQQAEDISLEICRFVKMVDFCVALRHPLYVTNANCRDVEAAREKIEETLFGFTRFTPEQQETVNDLFQELEKVLKTDRSLTQEEKQMIHLAMSKDFFQGAQGKGHWFTCSKGHYYCITECGGAMQVSKCPECGETIGGTNHRYVSTARLASDMDGATRPAWSAGFDMRNYANL